MQPTIASAVEDRSGPVVHGAGGQNGCEFQTSLQANSMQALSCKSSWSAKALLVLTRRYWYLSTRKTMRHISVQYGDGVRDNGIVGLGMGCFGLLDFLLRTFRIRNNTSRTGLNICALLASIDPPPFIWCELHKRGYDTYWIIKIFICAVRQLNTAIECRVLYYSLLIIFRSKLMIYWNCKGFVSFEDDGWGWFSIWTKAEVCFWIYRDQGWQRAERDLN